MMTRDCQLETTPAGIRFQLNEPLAGDWGLCLGFFDGVHQGHQELLRRLVNLASEKACQPAVWTFDRVPKLANQPGLLMTRAQRQACLAQWGLKALVWQPFTAALQPLSAAEFLQALSACLKLKVLVVGDDFRFGSDPDQSMATLRAWAQAHHIHLEIVEAVCLDEQPIHTRALRKALTEGQMSVVTRGLGRPYSLEGEVHPDRGVGKTLGFPTANLTVQTAEAIAGQQVPLVLPPCGVYRTQTWIRGQAYPSVSNLGYRPTAHEPHPALKLETHLLDCQLDCYGAHLKVDFLEWLRPEQTFDSWAALKAQIEQDCQKARQEPPAHCALRPVVDEPAVRIQVLPQAKFQTGWAVLQVRVPLDEQAGARYLASQYLVEVSQKYARPEDMAQALNALYGARLEAGAAKLGAWQILEFSVWGLREIEGQRPFVAVLDLLLETLLEPLETAEGSWQVARFDTIRRSVEDEWESWLLAPDYRAWKRAIELAYPAGAYALPAQGAIETIRSCTAEQAQQAWWQVLANAPLDLFLSTPVSPAILTRLKDGLKALKQTAKTRLSEREGALQAPLQRPLQPVYHPGVDPQPMQPILAEERTQVERIADTLQTHWVSLWQLPTWDTILRSIPLEVFAVLVGGPASTLFETVREQKGLAYHIQAQLLSGRGALAIESGLHKGAADEALAVTGELFERLKREGPSEEEMRRAKQQVVQEVSSLGDDLVRFMRFHLNLWERGLHLCLEDYLEQVKQVSPLHMQQVARCLQLALDYRLEPEAEGYEAQQTGVEPNPAATEGSSL